MKHKTIILCLFLIPLWGISQTDSLSIKEKREKRPTYIEVGLGLGTTNMRDFATSPLFYKGPGLNFSLGRTSFDSERESNLAFNYQGGILSTGIGDDDSQSSFHSFGLLYRKQYLIPKISNAVWNVKVGGELNAVSNFRVNNELLNSAIGLETIFTVFGTVQVGRDVSRKVTKAKKCLFIKYNLKPRRRYLSYTLKTGILNNNYRNGYSYIGEYALKNKTNVFEDYSWNSFSGMRIASSLDYTIYLENKNAVRISYVTDIYTTNGDYGALEVAQYTLKFALLFNTK